MVPRTTTPRNSGRGRGPFPVFPFPRFVSCGVPVMGFWGTGKGKGRGVVLLLIDPGDKPFFSGRSVVAPIV